MQPGAQQPRQTAGIGAAAVGRDTRFSPLELEHLRLALQASAVQHGTHLQHTPLNLVLALTGEVGSLAQLFQWRRPTPTDQLNLTTSEQQQLSEQLSGVLLHLIRLSDVCQIDLARAALEKLSRDHEVIHQLTQGRSPAQQQQQLVHGQRTDHNRLHMPTSPVAGRYISSAAAAAAAAAASAGETASVGSEQHLPHHSGIEIFAHPAAAAAAASSGPQLSVSRLGGSYLGFPGHGLLSQTSAQTTSTVAAPSSHHTVHLQAGLSDSSEQITAAAAAAAAAAAGPPGGQVAPTPAAAAAAMEAAAGGNTGTLSIDVLRLLATLASEDPASAIGLLAANPSATETLLQELSDPHNPARALLPAALSQQGAQPGGLQQIASGPEAVAAAAALPRFREADLHDPAAAAAAAGAGSSMYQGRGWAREREISAQLKREDLTAGSTSRRPRPGLTSDAAAGAAAAAAAGQQQQAADVSYSRMLLDLAAAAAAAAVPPAAAIGAAVERVMSGGLPLQPTQLAAAAAAELTPAAAAGEAALTASQPSFGESPATGSILGPGALINQWPGATAHPAAGISPKPQPVSTPAAAAVAPTAAAAAAAAATGTVSPPNLPEFELEDYGTDVRRKRFSDHEVQALTHIAESANWSLTNLSVQEREAVCNAFHIGINRLQNFFNNRKPKGLKRGRPRPQQSHGPAYSMPGMQGYSGLEEGYHQLQQQQQQQQQAGLVPAEGGVGYGVLDAAAAAALAAVGGLQEHISGPYDVSQGRSRSNTPATHQQQITSHLEPAVAAADTGAATGEETLASPRRKRRAVSEQPYAHREPLLHQGPEGHLPQVTPQGSAGTMGQGLPFVRPGRVQPAHSSGAQGLAPTSQGFAATCQGFASADQGFALISLGLDLGPFGTPLAQGLQPEVAGTPGAQVSGPTAIALQGSEQQQQQGIAAAAIAAAAGSLGPDGGGCGFEAQPAAAGMTAPAPTAAAPPSAPTLPTAQASAQALIPSAAEHAAGLTIEAPGSSTPTAAAAAAADSQATND